MFGVDNVPTLPQSSSLMRNQVSDHRMQATKILESLGRIRFSILWKFILIPTPFLPVCHFMQLSGACRVSEKCITKYPY